MSGQMPLGATAYNYDIMVFTDAAGPAEPYQIGLKLLYDSPTTEY